MALAAAAHVVGGGSVVTLPGLLALAALTSLAGYAVLGDGASTTRIVAFVVSAQVALHVLLEIGSAASGHATVGAAHPGHVDAMVRGSWSLVVDHLVGDVTSTAGLTMTAAHAVAALLVGAWLAAGDVLLLSLMALTRSAAAARALRALASLWIRPVAAVDLWHSYLAALSRRRGGRWHPVSWVPLATPARRGPPVAA